MKTGDPKVVKSPKPSSFRVGEFVEWISKYDGDSNQRRKEIKMLAKITNKKMGSITLESCFSKEEKEMSATEL